MAGEALPFGQGQGSFGASLIAKNGMAAKRKGPTPLMRQYHRIKERHADAILLFRMGDFYETFEEDAHTLHKVLGITLTKRSNGQAADVPLAGFPHHALDNYLPKLVRAGHRVAVCEQTEDPKQAKTIVRREVVEVVTPGVALTDQLLEPKRSNYLTALHVAGGVAGISYIDASTGEFVVTECAENRLQDVLATIDPAELLIRQGTAPPRTTAVVTSQEEWRFTEEFAQETLLRHFGTHSLKGFGIEDMMAGVVAAGVALQYLSETQQGRVPHVGKLNRLASDQYMALDPQTKRNLELIGAMQGGTEGSLVGILDRTCTSMGGRMLRRWLVRPLIRVEDIQFRLEAVDSMFASRRLRERSRSMLGSVSDLERIAARAATGRALPRDLHQLRVTLNQLPEIAELLESEPCDSLRALAAGLNPMPDVVQLLDISLVDEPPATLKDGGVIRPGYSQELDDLRGMASGGKEWLARLQESEVKRTGIPSLKVGYNKVFGYYLEVTHAHRDKVPDNYIRKQTLVNAERYITPELKEHEERILTAEERMSALELELFTSLREQVAQHTEALQDNGRLLAALDVYASLAETAAHNRYVRPFVHEGTDIEIEKGRHPVVEQLLPPGEPFIPNSVRLDAEDEQIMIITGPNMAGKSVVLRQVGLIVLLAQIGSFVPAEKARIGVVDRIFTRVGATDNLAAGESTFLVEMNEAANILNNASKRSLILLDEVGRGTSTFDGLSIAWALVEYLHEQPDVAARTLFATHYHELNELASRFSRIRNYRVQVQEYEGRVIFLRHLVPGGADHSYGIEVARMAGLPESMIGRAREVLRHLESQVLVVGERGEQQTIRPSLSGLQEAQMSLFAAQEPDPVVEEVLERLRGANTDHLTPIEALLLLDQLRKRLEGG